MLPLYPELLKVEDVRTHICAIFLRIFAKFILLKAKQEKCFCPILQKSSKLYMFLWHFRPIPLRKIFCQKIRLCKRINFQKVCTQDVQISFTHTFYNRCPNPNNQFVSLCVPLYVFAEEPQYRRNLHLNLSICPPPLLLHLASSSPPPPPLLLPLPPPILLPIPPLLLSYCFSLLPPPILPSPQQTCKKWQMARMPFAELFRLCKTLPTQQKKVDLCSFLQISGYFWEFLCLLKSCSENKNKRK